MSEATPAPTPCRAVYGFAWFLLFKTLFILYVFWAFTPEYILEEVLGLTYLPDKYFALVLPILVLCALTVFAFLIYPPWNLAMQDDIDDIHTLYDQHTIKRCQYVDDISSKQCERKFNAIVPNDSNNPSDWRFEKYCFEHDITKFEQNARLSPSGDDNIDGIDAHGFCDCVNKANCLLYTNPNHLELLKNRATVPSAFDLDIVDVCKQLYLDK